MSNSLWPHGLYSPWNSPGQNTGVGSLSLLQGIFWTRDRTQVSHIAGGFFASWATKEAQEYWSGQPIPSPAGLPDLGIKPGSPALQADSSPAEPQGTPKNTGVGSLSLLQWMFLIQESNWGLLHCRWIFYQLSLQVYFLKQIHHCKLTVLQHEINFFFKFMREESTGKMFHTNLDSSANKYKQNGGMVVFLSSACPL